MANRDVLAVQRILADDFIGVEADDGHLYDKGEAIFWIRKHHSEYISNHLDDVKIRFFGNTAVAQGSESWERRTASHGVGVSCGRIPGCSEMAAGKLLPLKT